MTVENERMITNAEEIIPHQCIVCQRLLSGKRRCEAFPNGIPGDILLSEFDHRQPHVGDRGLRFAPKPGRRHPLTIAAD